MDEGELIDLASSWALQTERHIQRDVIINGSYS